MSDSSPGLAALDSRLLGRTPRPIKRDLTPVPANVELTPEQPAVAEPPSVAPAPETAAPAATAAPRPKAAPAEPVPAAVPKPVFFNNRIRPDLKIKVEDLLIESRRKFNLKLTSEELTEFMIEEMLPPNMTEGFINKLRHYRSKHPRD